MQQNTIEAISPVIVKPEYLEAWRDRLKQQYSLLKKRRDSLVVLREFLETLKSMEWNSRRIVRLDWSIINVTWAIINVYEQITDLNQEIIRVNDRLISALRYTANPSRCARHSGSRRRGGNGTECVPALSEAL